jgi:hypothetical protein
MGNIEEEREKKKMNANFLGRNESFEGLEVFPDKYIIRETFRCPEGREPFYIAGSIFGPARMVTEFTLTVTVDLVCPACGFYLHCTSEDLGIAFIRSKDPDEFLDGYPLSKVSHFINSEGEKFVQWAFRFSKSKYGRPTSYARNGNMTTHDFVMKRFRQELKEAAAEGCTLRFT